MAAQSFWDRLNEGLYNNYDPLFTAVHFTPACAGKTLVLSENLWYNPPDSYENTDPSKEEITIASGKFSNSRSTGKSPRQSVPEHSRQDAIDEEWESFLATVNKRYGGEPVAPVQQEPEEEAYIPPVPPVASHTAKKNTRKAERGHGLRNALIAVCLIAVLAAGAMFAIPMIRSASDPYGGKILDGVTAAGVNISGMTKRQAAKAIENAIGNALTQRDMTIGLKDKTLSLSPKDTGATLDVDGLVEAAYSRGRSDSAPAELNFLDYFRVNESAIRAALEEQAGTYSAQYTPASFTMQGTIPALDEGSFNPSAEPPALLLTVGTSGSLVNTDTLYTQILAAYADGSFTVDGSGLFTEKTPDPLDLAEVMAQLGIAPVNAQLDSATKQPIPGSYGLGFDMDAAQAQLNRAAPGETIRVSMTYIAPEVIGQEVYFQDILGFTQTPHGDNENRNANLRLACAHLNGVVLQPGDSLSYNETLGQRTREDGYKDAPAYSGTDLVDSLGGGICQVSSTLYLSSLYAEMETLSRVSHGYPASYMPVGLDATVSWPEPDLQIRNSSEYPVKIIAEDADGFVRVWIMGTETRDYYVKMGFSSSSDGYARSYVVKYDKKTDEQLSREPLHLSSYLSVNVSEIGEIAMNQAYVNGMVRDQEPCEPTAETLTESKNYKKPNSNAAVA